MCPKKLGRILAIIIYNHHSKLLTTIRLETLGNKDIRFCCANSDDGRCLDRNAFVYNNSAAQWTTATDQTNHCQLHLYSLSDVVTCINSINNVHRAGSLLHQSHFVFIGDSRARQQFFNFVKVIHYNLLHLKLL